MMHLRVRKTADFMEEWLDFSEFIDKTQEYIELGLYEEAIAILEEHMHLFEDEWEVYFLYSRILTEQNKPQAAIPYLHKGLRCDKTNADCLLGLFYAYSMLNQVKKAGKYLLRANKYHPDNELVNSSLIWYYTETSELEKAIDTFEKLHKFGTSNPETYRNGGIAFERVGQYERAESCFKTALEFNPQYEEARDLLADHYILINEPKKAIELYNEALIESPKNITIISRLVFCYTQDNQLDKAAALAKETIRLYPNSPVGYVDMAYIHLNTNEADEAVKDAERALDISPIDAEAFRVKGIAYSEKNETDEANKAFETAISLEPENTEIIRDYYHHLRTIGSYEKMEKMVNQVIKIEHPYCIEDYWFLSDYYREKEQNLRAFHYLHSAYKLMPGEKELIPPLVDIMLDEDHAKYSLPLLIKYVEKGGWNEVMNQFAIHKRLRGKWVQEGIRFLRFRGEKPLEYRRFIFHLYFKKFLFLLIGLVFGVSLFPSYVLFGFRGLFFVGTIAAAMATTYLIVVKLRIRKKLNQPEKNDDTQT